MKIPQLPKTSTLVAIGAIALGLATAGIGVTYAASNTGTSATTIGGRMSNLVNAIAQKFNLKTSDVQQVVDQQKTQMQAQQQQNFKDRLSAAVTAGTITQAQSDAITAKMAELKTQRAADKANFANLTPAQRQTQMQTEMTALKQWATDNNIPAGFLPFGGPGMGGRGHGGFGMHKEMPPANGTAPASTSAPATATN